MRLASSSDSKGWDNYLLHTRNRTLAHRWSWGEILASSFGVKPYYFIAERENSIVGILPTTLMKSRLFGSFLISLPWLDYGGPIADNDEIALCLVDTAIETASENNCSFLELRAVSHRLEGLREKADKFTFLLDLQSGEEDVWKSFNAKARNQVRKAEKSGLTVLFGDSDLLAEFYKVFARNMRDLGTPVWPKELFEEIFYHFPNDTEIAAVEYKSKIVAAALILHYGDYSIVPSASSYREYRRLCPNNIMYWEIIKHCISRGSILFDFGRSSEGAGTYHFKKQWVKKPTQQIWQYKLLSTNTLPELNPRNPKYRLAINIWSKMPLSIANFLGPKIITKLP